METRPSCLNCGTPAEKHSTRKGKTYYRTLCSVCRRPNRDYGYRVGKQLITLTKLGIPKEAIHTCDECGKTFPFNCELHHRDKNKEDNSRSNLAILCPNCHTLYHFLLKHPQS